jgi:predicted nucleic acid-binding protein
MLIDTNIFIEIGKGQKHTQVCEELLDAIKKGMAKEKAYITKFTLSAIEALMGEKHDEFLLEILLLVHQGLIKIYESNIQDDLSAHAMRTDLNLDFDDALQFVTANRLATYLVTYDKDFAKTSLPTKTPEEVLKALA